VLLVAAAFQYLRPLPVTAATPVIPASEVVGSAPVLPWPSRGMAAIVIDGFGAVGTSGGNTAAPMASTTKIMTALLVLEDHPLGLNETGPVLTVSRADVATYFSERSQGESVVPVTAGEQLTEYQLLQGLLLPSASNFADMLAAWDAGSVAAFIGRMNARAAALGMAATHYADVSGFSPASVSIPDDLIKLAQTAMRLPVFAQIVGQSQASLPVAGIIHNLDTLLGQDGVIGIKTGHTDQAGGCFVFAADFTVDGARVRVYGAVMGQPNFLPGAFAATAALLNGLRPVLHLDAVVHQGDVIARYRAAWDESGAIIAAGSTSWVLVDGTAVIRRTTLDTLPESLPAGSRIGTMTVTAGNLQSVVPLVTQAAINGPDIGWRLTRGF
jgi:D-alanyl-D-alanine carboxypeptidase (penicillin-binding protein 5/6)